MTEKKNILKKDDILYVFNQEELDELVNAENKIAFSIENLTRAILGQSLKRTKKQ